MTKRSNVNAAQAPDAEKTAAGLVTATAAGRDIMSLEKRSALMARIRGRDTGPERLMADLLRSLGVKFTEQEKSLHGRPDFLLEERIALFVDGDFWHGRRFSEWKHKLTPKWRHKITANIRRDRVNRRELRKRGWIVMRVWEHQLKRSPEHVRRRVRAKLKLLMVANDLAKSDEAVTDRA